MIDFGPKHKNIKVGYDENLMRLVKRLVVSIAFLLLAWLILWINYGSIPKRVDTSFATKAKLRYHYNDESIDVVINNPADVKSLKDTLKGWAYEGDPSGHCFTDADAAVTLTDGKQSIAFCPDFEGRYMIEVNKQGIYLHVSPDQWRAFDRVCRKYRSFFQSDTRQTEVSGFLFFRSFRVKK